MHFLLLNTNMNHPGIFLIFPRYSDAFEKDDISAQEKFRKGNHLDYSTILFVQLPCGPEDISLSDDIKASWD